MLGADKFIDRLKPEQQKLHATQRYSDGISDIDMWNFDVFLADVIVAGCKWMIENGNTSPWNLPDGEWNEILTEIMDGFAGRGGDGLPQPSKRAWKLLRRNFKYMWD